MRVSYLLGQRSLIISVDGGLTSEVRAPLTMSRIWDLFVPAMLGLVLGLQAKIFNLFNLGPEAHGLRVLHCGLLNLTVSYTSRIIATTVVNCAVFFC